MAGLLGSGPQDAFGLKSLFARILGIANDQLVVFPDRYFFEDYRLGAHNCLTGFRLTAISAEAHCETYSIRIRRNLDGNDSQQVRHLWKNRLRAS